MPSIVALNIMAASPIAIGRWKVESASCQGGSPCAECSSAPGTVPAAGGYQRCCAGLPGAGGTGHCRPASGSVLPSGAGGSLEVAAAVSPPLDAGYVLGLEVDGVLVTTGDSPLTLTQLERGEHRIVLVVIDPDRKVRQRSDAVVLHVQRARVAAPTPSRHGPSS